MASLIGVEKHFKILQGRSDVPDFLQAADVLIHPSIKESAGMVIVEAIVAGLPVLCTDTCGYAFHVKKAEAGYICSSPFQQDELDRQLQSVLRDEAQRQKWKENGIAYGRNNDLYSMPETVAAILVQAASAYVHQA